MCKTCPFGPEGLVELRNTVMTRMLNDGVSQVCHGTEGKNRKPNSLCRGARDQLLVLFHRMQFIDEPTDEAWDAKRRVLGV